MNDVDDVFAGLPEDRIRRLRRLIEEVLRVNQQFNLTAIREDGDAWSKHIMDSLHGLRTGLFESWQRVVDIGAGAGFPGLPLAIARPELKLTLIEATRKKCDFLEVTIEKFQLNATVICARAETVGQDQTQRERFHIATARAVGSFSEVCELGLPLIEVGGHLVLWRGERAPEEIEAARRALQTLGGQPGPVFSYHLPGHDFTYYLVVIEKIAATPPQFPRRIGLPKQRPL